MEKSQNSLNTQEERQDCIYETGQGFYIFNCTLYISNFSCKITDSVASRAVYTITISKLLSIKVSFTSIGIMSTMVSLVIKL